MDDAFPTPLVSIEWLAEHLNDPHLRILDATVLLSPPSEPGKVWTVESNRQLHDALHIPGSHHADLIAEFSAPIGRFPRPSVEVFKSSIARLAIGPNTRVVIYDRASCVWAARLWWVMKSFGLEASVLDGGFSAWQSGERPTASEILPLGSVAPFAIQDQPELFADRDDVLAFVKNGGACLVNALDATDFYAMETNSYARPGRIPGSLNIPASSLLDPHTGKFFSTPVLEERFAEVISRPGRKVLCCGGGVAACADALALTILGEDDLVVYDASLEEWAAEPSLPMEVGSRIGKTRLGFARPILVGAKD